MRSSNFCGLATAAPQAGANRPDVVTATSEDIIFATAAGTTATNRDIVVDSTARSRLDHRVVRDTVPRMLRFLER